MATSLIVPRQTDRDASERFGALAKMFSGKIRGQTVRIVGGMDVASPLLESKLPDSWLNLVGKDLDLISEIHLNIDHWTIRYYRGGKGEPKSPYQDEIHIGDFHQQTQLTDDEKLAVLVTLRQEFRAVDFKGGGALPTPYQEQVLAVHESTLSRLEGLNEQLIRGSEEFRQKLEGQYLEKAESLNREIIAREEQTAARVARENQSLAEQREDLEKRKREFDDRDHTHVRRELRKQMLDEIKSRFSSFTLTKTTKRLRWPIHVVCMVVMALGIWGSIVYASQTFDYLLSDKFDLRVAVGLLLKGLGVTAITMGLAVFYLRWLTRWADQHAQAEFHLKQTQLDVERANWIVETCLEWRKAEGGAIPTTLLKGITRNLFHLSDSANVEKTNPADQLASALLGTASRLNLKVGESNLDIDPKKLKRSGK